MSSLQADRLVVKNYSPSEPDRDTAIAHDFRTGGPGWDIIGRVQFNICRHISKIDREHFANSAKKDARPRVFLQLDSFNREFSSQMLNADVNSSTLFDLSGGKGQLPRNGWPAATNGKCGYAGGLTPSNLTEQLWSISRDAHTAKSVLVDAKPPFRPWYFLNAHQYFAKADPWVR
ncbi:hypothetical protein Pan189_03730 [Stratiformator vulcanicus]|uniref:Uncharacterized protein n=1 Tax=Stratiformator vulcanicus TaxID=2527980 RepID=A0A517QWS5_9PLAN|nr:hypothetical protein Pan189_03730 [Stratiformator vulcanicus]